MTRSPKYDWSLAWYALVCGVWAASLFRMFWRPQPSSPWLVGASPDFFLGHVPTRSLWFSIGLGVVGPVTILVVCGVSLGRSARFLRSLVHGCALGWSTIYACVWGFGGYRQPPIVGGWLVFAQPALGGVAGLVLAFWWHTRRLAKRAHDPGTGGSRS